MTISYAVEILYHLCCDNCKLWWSVASPDGTLDGTTLTCPFCTLEGELTPLAVEETYNSLHDLTKVFRKRLERVDNERT